MSVPEVKYTGHALRRMFQRGISQADVAAAVAAGVVAEAYPDDTPYPSRLLYAEVDGRPIHVVVADDVVAGTQYIVTAYEPDIGQWCPDWLTRRA